MSKSIKLFFKGGYHTQEIRVVQVFWEMQVGGLKSTQDGRMD